MPERKNAGCCGSICRPAIFAKSHCCPALELVALFVTGGAFFPIAPPPLHQMEPCQQRRHGLTNTNGHRGQAKNPMKKVASLQEPYIGYIPSQAEAHACHCRLRCSIPVNSQSSFSQIAASKTLSSGPIQRSTRTLQVEVFQLSLLLCSEAFRLRNNGSDLFCSLPTTENCSAYLNTHPPLLERSIPVRFFLNHPSTAKSSTKF